MWRISFWSRGLVRAAVCLCPCRCVKGGEDVLGFVYLCLVSLVSVPHVNSHIRGPSCLLLALD